jgi:hypothetical protein
MVDEWNTPSFRTRGGLLWMSCACFLAAVVLGTFRSTVAAHAMGVHSWGSLCYFAYLWLETDRWQRNPAEARCPPAALGG